MKTLEKNPNPCSISRYCSGVAMSLLKNVKKICAKCHRGQMTCSKADGSLQKSTSEP